MSYYHFQMVRAKSKAWNYFKKIGEGEAKCRRCNSIQSCSNGTSSMLYHLRADHDIEPVCQPNWKTMKSEAIIIP